MRVTLLMIALMGLFSISIAQHKEIVLTQKQKSKVALYPKTSTSPINTTVLNVGNTGSSKDATVGSTYYDLQTYNSLQRRMYTWPDGTTGITWAMGYLSASWSDIGTGYNYFDGNNWGTSPAQIIEQNPPASSPNYFSFGEEGEIIVSHYKGVHWKLAFHTRETRGTGNWDYFELEGPEADVGIAWASVMVNGADNKTIHVLTKTTENPYMGQTTSFVYCRSQNGGSSWDIQYHNFEGLGPDYLNNVGRDTYTWAYPKGDTIAFTAGFATGNGYIMKSYDNGNNWDRISVYENPFSPYTSGETPHFGSGDGTSCIALDSDGMAHVVFGRMVYYYNYLSNLYYVPTTEGLIYWNESMPMLDTTAVSSYTLDHLSEGGNLIGWVTSQTGDSTLLEFGTYYLSLTTWPQITIDPSDRIFVAYSGVALDYNNEVMNYRHIYVNSSSDKGETWNGMKDINTDIVYSFTECIFPSISPHIQDSKLHCCFQEDYDHGLYAWIGQQEFPTENRIRYMPVDINTIVGQEEYTTETSRLTSCTNFPNPFKDKTTFEFQLKQAAHIILEIRDITGKRFLNQNLGLKHAGRNVIQFENQNLESGIYFYTLKSDNESISGKMIVQ